PVLPETAPLRRAATQLVQLAWRRHRRELPAGTAKALATIFHLAPPLPVIERMKIGIECIATRFAPASRGGDLIAWCAEIEVVFPGFFSRPALWPPVLQPPP